MTSFREWLFRAWYWYVSKVDKDAEILCMNYGYASPDGALDLDPADEPQRYSLQLYHHLASAVELEGKDLLEVGSGRGGGLAFLARRFNLNSALGLELNARAVRFCDEHYRAIEGLKFVQGDAQAMNLPAESCDVVINVESSHRYPDMVAFLSEVKRVLRPGGHFLFTDFRYDHEMEELADQLSATGLTRVKEERITADVVRALDLDDPRKRALIKKLAPRLLHKVALDFAGAKGSDTYTQFADRKYEYVSIILRKD